MCCVGINDQWFTVAVLFVSISDLSCDVSVQRCQELRTLSDRYVKKVAVTLVLFHRHSTGVKLISIKILFLDDII